MHLQSRAHKKGSGIKACFACEELCVIVWVLVVALAAGKSTLEGGRGARQSGPHKKKRLASIFVRATLAGTPSSLKCRFASS